MLASSPDGKELAVLLPTSSGTEQHFPVVVYPCNAPSCAANATNIYSELNLTQFPHNLNGGLLFYKGQTFGAADLNSRGMSFSQDPWVVKDPPLHLRPPHSWMTRWWYHMRGEVPTAATEGQDSAWGLSLPQITPCAMRTPQDGERLFANGQLAGILHIKADKIIPIEAQSEASVQEWERGMCKPAGPGDKTYAYVPTVRFGPWYWPFDLPNQATADIAVIELSVDRGVSIQLTDNKGYTDRIQPYVAASDKKLEILFGNLFPVNTGIPSGCDPNTGHFELYNNLLDNGCKLPQVPQLGWKSTRVKKLDIGQTDDALPGVVKVVSLDSDGQVPIRNPLHVGPFSGLARPICYLATN